MVKQIFISHSKNDNKNNEDIVPYFVDMFSGTDIKAVLMEYEELSRGDKPLRLKKEVTLLFLTLKLDIWIDKIIYLPINDQSSRTLELEPSEKYEFFN